MRKKAGTITTLLLVIVLAVSSVQALSFPDVTEGKWFYKNITTLMNKGIINGNPDGTFKPYDNVYVDAFIKMVVTALGHKMDNGKPYWASSFIDKAKSIGLVEDGEFTNYQRNITRAEMARIIVRALKEEYSQNLNDYKTLIGDYNNIGDEYKEYILKAYSKGIITGYTDGTFKPGNNAQRCEAAAMIHRLIDSSQRKVPSTSKTEVINGYTVPVDRVAIVEKPSESTGADIGITILYTNPDTKPVQRQLDEAYIVIKSKFGEEKATEVINYVKQKKDNETGFETKEFFISGQKIWVAGKVGSWSARIVIYKSGV